MADGSRLWSSFHPLFIFVFVLSFIHGHSFCDSPHYFHMGQPMEVKANKLTSNKTQLSYPFYSIPYCRPHQIVNSVQNFGEILRGDHIQNSLYQFNMGFQMRCNIVCRITLNEKTTKEFNEKIDDGYRANMLLDNLPLIVPVTRTDDDSQSIYQLGYFVGSKVRDENTTNEKYVINNHLSFIVSYHRDAETNAKRIVRFEAKAFSIKHKYDDPCCVKIPLTMCHLHENHVVRNSEPLQEIDDNKDVFFTYDVEFRVIFGPMESDVKWTSRWNTYILTNDDHIPWFSVMNSLMNVLLNSGIVAAAMLGTLYRCISAYNRIETLEEAQKETGWQLVRTDVFRPPVNSQLLCVYVGTGVQIFIMIIITIISGILGFLSPTTFGVGFMTDVVLFWALVGIFGGFTTGRLYKTFEGSEWTKTTLKTACMFPGLVFLTLLILNVVKWSEGSMGSIQFGNMFVLAALWFGLSIPLVFIGSYIGFKGSGIKYPVKTSDIPREIPEQRWYMRPFFSIMIGGIIPSVAVFNRLFFILTSIGLPQFYYMFGLVIVVLIIICVEVTIFICYLHISNEDYRWWWRSYLTSGSLAFYFFLYATFYFFAKLNIRELAPSILYFGYMLIASSVIFAMMGTIGFFACFWFTRLIYSSVKIA